MPNCFDIYMFPADEGDCFWIRYGDVDNSHNILIDGGRKRAAGLIKEFMLQLPEGERKLDLLVVTHIDRDHIEGILDLIGDSSLQLTIADIWFNAYHHLRDESMGAVMGENLSKTILARNWPWNMAFGGNAVKIADDGRPRTIPLAGGMILTLLSPNTVKLQDLAPVWEKEWLKATTPKHEDTVKPPAPGDSEELGTIDINVLAASPLKRDTKEANGSSIAFILEYNGRRALFAADAHPDLLLQNLQRSMLEKGEKLKIDAFKVPHHGSKNNISKELLECIDCPTYLVSTSGSQFHHPDYAAVAKILKFGGSRKKLVFNYRSDENEVWDSVAWQNRYGYQTSYPNDDDTGSIKLSLLSEEQF